MKIRKSAFTKIIPLFLVVLLIGCSTPKYDVYNSLMEHANSVKVINTHEHQRTPSELEYSKFNFWTVLHKSYLRADVVSAGAKFFSIETVNNSSLDEMWELYGEYLNYTANSSYYQHFIEGIKKCYEYDEPVFTKEGIELLSKQIADKYADYETWFDNCFQEANFETMFLDQYWAPHNFDINRKHFSLIFQVNKLVYDIAGAKQVYNDENGDFVEYKKTFRVESINTLNDYLNFADFMLQSAIKKGAVGLKNSMAYGRSIDYENVPLEKAIVLFEKSQQLNADEEKALQDFMFHWFLEKAAKFNLPVQIHTGYLAGNGNQLDNGKPIKLNNIFLQHPKIKFDLFHGGFPWTGEFVALGKMFSNVYLNLVWLPQISKERALVTFDEMLDCVPYNKILWGGDCHFIEETVGSLEFGKLVVCEVLAKRVNAGQMDEATAKKIITGIFRKNAVELFRLEQRISLN